MSSTQIPTSHIDAWPEETLKDRIERARAFLYAQNLITETENQSIMQRTHRWLADHRGRKKRKRLLNKHRAKVQNKD